MYIYIYTYSFIHLHIRLYLCVWKMNPICRALCSIHHPLLAWRLGTLVPLNVWSVSAPQKNDMDASKIAHQTSASSNHLLDSLVSVNCMSVFRMCREFPVFAYAIDIPWCHFHLLPAVHSQNCRSYDWPVELTAIAILIDPNCSPLKSFHKSSCWRSMTPSFH